MILGGQVHKLMSPGPAGGPVSVESLCRWVGVSPKPQAIPIYPAYKPLTERALHWPSSFA